MGGDKGAEKSVRIGYGVDMGLLGPTALSLASAVASTPNLQNVDILGSNLTEDAIELLRRIATAGEIPIQFHLLSEEDFGEIPSTFRHITKTPLAGLLLPSLIEDRVIDIDGDTLVRRDLGELYGIDLQDSLIGGVRDFGCIKSTIRIAEVKVWQS